MAVDSDHDRLIRVDERTKDMVSDIAEIKEWMKQRPCPSDLCSKHNGRLVKLETTAAWQWVAIASSYVFTGSIMSMLWAHVAKVV